MPATVRRAQKNCHFRLYKGLRRQRESACLVLESLSRHHMSGFGYFVKIVFTKCEQKLQIAVKPMTYFQNILRPSKAKGGDTKEE